MSTDLATPAPSAPSEDTTSAVVVVPATRHRRRGWLLLAVAAWSVWVWGTRVLNLVRAGEEYSTAFVVVHAVLYGSAFVIAGGLARMGVRMVREAR